MEENMNKAMEHANKAMEHANKAMEHAIAAQLVSNDQVGYYRHALYQAIISKAPQEVIDQKRDAYRKALLTEQKNIAI
jgi:hypothetical protein